MAVKRRVSGNIRFPKRSQASSHKQLPSDDSGSVGEAQIVQSSDESESSEQLPDCSVCDSPLRENGSRLRHLKCHKKCGERTRAIQYHLKKVGDARQKPWKTQED